MPPKLLQRLPAAKPWLRWLVSLTLPGMLLGLCGLAFVGLEIRTHYLSVHMGAFLLDRNPGQAERGAVWQGILASRRSRSGLEQEQAADSLHLDALPAPLLHSHYQLERPSPDFAILRARNLPTPLEPGRIPPARLPQLALSLQAYKKGQALLDRAGLSPETYLIHAQIKAELALEDGTLFPLIYRELAARKLPEAWNFVNMPEEERRYWHELFAEHLTAVAVDLERSAAPQESVSHALDMLVRSWQDSLYSAELNRLRQAWKGGEAREIRLLRNMDVFTGYLLTPREAPVHFIVPAKAAEAILGLQVEAIP